MQQDRDKKIYREIDIPFLSCQGSVFLLNMSVRRVDIDNFHIITCKVSALNDQQAINHQDPESQVSGRLSNCNNHFGRNTGGIVENIPSGTPFHM